MRGFAQTTGDQPWVGPLTALDRLRGHGSSRVGLTSHRARMGLLLHASQGHLDSSPHR